MPDQAAARHPVPPLSVVIAVLTYRRPELLAANLAKICEQVEHVTWGRYGGSPRLRSQVLVVDNDPDGSGRAAVADGAPGVRYVIESVPGIAAARNRALREAAGHDLLVFIDDDEEPLPGWLDSLLLVWEQTGAAGVVGRVVPAYQVTPAPWIEAGGFFVRKTMPTGTRRPAAAAGNLLLDLKQLEPTGIGFDEPFGLTGGEDTLMTRRMVTQGLQLVWCDESVAKDLIPAERLTRRWVLSRAWSHGNTQALIDVHLTPAGTRRTAMRITLGVTGAGRVLAGAGQFARGVLRRSLRDRARGARLIMRGAGFATGAWGMAFEEYAR
ncbi:glycosyltransferase [Allobranchiibius sp. CTAmp26]|nr:glycosyltransferase [Allobranchiibius sp. CTAmp26]